MATFDSLNISQTETDPNNFQRTVEKSAPVLPSYITPAATSVPRLGQGIVTGSIIAKTNNELVHVCDFANLLKKNSSLRKYLLAQWEDIKEAIRAVLRTLGLSDPSGSLSSTASWLRGLAREIINFQKRVINPIINFEKEVIGYIAFAEAMVVWIQSLPARLQAILQGCLLKLLSSLLHLLDGAFSNPFSDVTNATKQVISATVQTVASVQVAVAAASVISQQAGSLLSSSQQSKQSSANVSSALTTASQPTTANTSYNDVVTANSTLSLLTSTIPSANSVANTTTQSLAQKKSTP